MLAGRAFQFYTEGRILFPPTYKYDVGMDDYDTSYAITSSAALIIRADKSQREGTYSCVV